MHRRDFFDTTTLVTALAPSKQDISKHQDKCCLKVLSRVKRKETKGYISWLNIVEFIGVLAEKAKESHSFINKRLEDIEDKFNIEVIYPSYRIEMGEEFEKTSDVMKYLLKQWTEDVKEMSIRYRLNGIDASHILTAVENDCSRFITWDGDFLNNPLLRGRQKELNNILITSPDRIV